MPFQAEETQFPRPAESRPAPSLDDFDFARVRVIDEKRRRRNTIARLRPEAVIGSTVPVVICLSAAIVVTRLARLDLGTVCAALILGCYVPILLAAGGLAQWAEELDQELDQLEAEHAALTGPRDGCTDCA